MRGRPVIVGGDPHSRGVVATASYEARKFGIHSAQPCKTALQICPDAVFLRPRFDVYRAISQQILAIYRQCTPLVEPLALDEAYLDVTTVVGETGSATRIAQRLKQIIFEQTRLTSSAGVSYNKLLAKIASGHQKPGGLTVITPQMSPAFLDGLSISKFFGVGEVTKLRLKELGVVLGRDLRQLSLMKLQELFGKRGTMLYYFVRGEDDRPVEPERTRKSVGKEITFESDMTDPAEMRSTLEHLAEQVALRLIELGLAGTTITLKLRWHDFQLVTRSVSVAQPLQDSQGIMHSIQPLLSQFHLLCRRI